MNRPATAFRLAAGATACLVALAACGTRVDDAEIQAGAGGGPVPLPTALLGEIAASYAPKAPAAAAQPGAPAAAPQPGTGTAAAPAAAGPGQAGTPAAPSGPKREAPGATAAQAPAAGPAAHRAPAARAPAAPAAAASAGCTRSLEPVVLGQVGTFSGVAGPVAAGGRSGLAVWAKDVNARGGLACHPVVLYAQDDGGDPSKSAAAVRELVQTKKAVGIVGSFVAFSIAGFRSEVENLKVPAIGGDLIPADWHASPYLFAQGASIDDQIHGFISQGVQAGRKKLGVLYCVEVSACTYGHKVIEDGGGAKKAGADLVYSSAISLTQTDFTAQCQNAKNAGVDQLALGMDGSAMVRVARSCAAIGYRPLLSGIGLTISAAQAEDPNLREFKLATATGNAPWTEKDKPGLAAFHEALAKYAPGVKPDAASSQAWASGKLVEAAVAKLGAAAQDGPLTTADLMKGLSLVRNETLGGLAGPLTFTAGQKRSPSSGCVYYELLTTEGWTAPRGSRAVCQ